MVVAFAIVWLVGVVFLVNMEFDEKKPSPPSNGPVLTESMSTAYGAVVSDLQNACTVSQEGGDELGAALRVRLSAGRYNDVRRINERGGEELSPYPEYISATELLNGNWCDMHEHILGPR